MAAHSLFFALSDGSIAHNSTPAQITFLHSPAMNHAALQSLRDQMEEVIHLLETYEITMSNVGSDTTAPAGSILGGFGALMLGS